MAKTCHLHLHCITPTTCAISTIHNTIVNEIAILDTAWHAMTRPPTAASLPVYVTFHVRTPKCHALGSFILDLRIATFNCLLAIDNEPDGRF